MVGIVVWKWKISLGGRSVGMWGVLMGGVFEGTPGGTQRYMYGSLLYTQFDLYYIMVYIADSFLFQMQGLGGRFFPGYS